MIAGFLLVTTRAVETHRDSYVLDHITVASVRRPFLAGGAMFALGLAGFAWANADLLYPHEIAILTAMASLCLLAGLATGQLQLLSRDVRGSELSGAVYGTYPHLNLKRREIVRALQAQRSGDRS